MTHCQTPGSKQSTDEIDPPWSQTGREFILDQWNFSFWEVTTKHYDHWMMEQVDYYNIPSGADFILGQAENLGGVICPRS